MDDEEKDTSITITNKKMLADTIIQEDSVRVCGSSLKKCLSTIRIINPKLITKG